MRGRRPVGPEYADQLPGSDLAKERLKVILETMAGTCRVLEACARLGISEQRFHQLREEMMTGALAALEPGQAGRPARIPTPAETQVQALAQQLQAKDIELRTAQARAEIAVVLPGVVQRQAEPEKKTPSPPTPRRRRGRKKNT
jgi:hypothetical protein